MFNPLTAINAPYLGVLQFIQNLSPYDCNTGCDEMLDLIREIQQSGAYFWQGVAIPNSINTTIPALQTLNGTAHLPEGSYITAITCFGDSVVNPEGFKFKLYDEGTKASIFFGDYALERTVASDMQTLYGVGNINAPTCPGMNADNPFGPNYLLSPFVITKPGIIGWEIVNQSVADAVIQLMLSVAIPANKKTASQIVVVR
jgi:hypothetical protein